MEWKPHLKCKIDFVVWNSTSDSDFLDHNQLANIRNEKVWDDSAILIAFVGPRGVMEQDERLVDYWWDLGFNC